MARRVSAVSASRSLANGSKPKRNCIVKIHNFLRRVSRCNPIKRSCNRHRNSVPEASGDKTPNLNSVVRARDWEGVHSFLRTDYGAWLTEDPGQFHSPSTLAVAVGSNAPADVVAMIIERNPGAVDDADHSLKLPIHIACSHGASVEVVELLLRASSSSVLRRDRDGRLPLHFAVEYCVGSYDHDYGQALEVVAVLRASAPTGACHRDAWGETPEDIAEEAEVTAGLESDHEVMAAARAVRRILRRTTMSKENNDGVEHKREARDLVLAQRYSLIEQWNRSTIMGEPTSGTFPRRSVERLMA